MGILLVIIALLALGARLSGDYYEFWWLVAIFMHTCIHPIGLLSVILIAFGVDFINDGDAGALGWILMGLGLIFNPIIHLIFSMFYGEGYASSSSQEYYEDYEEESDGSSSEAGGSFLGGIFDKKEEHYDWGNTKCIHCGSGSMGPGCPYSPEVSRTGMKGVHHHNAGDGRCVYCGSKAVGPGCPYSPTSNHSKL